MLILLLSSSVLSMLSSSWVVLWLLMELNFFTFLYVSIKDHQALKWAWPLSYFTVQAITTSIFLMSCMLKALSFSLLLVSFMVPMAMWLKMALVPLHYWAYPHVGGMNYNTLWLFISLQKLPSFAVFSSLMEELYLTQILVALTILVSPLVFTFQINIKELVFISSSVSTASAILLIYWSTSTLWLLLILSMGLYGFMCYGLHLFSLDLMSKVQVFSSTLGSMTSIGLTLMGFPMFSMFYCKLLLLTCLGGTSTVLFLALLAASVAMMHTYLKLFTYRSMIGNLFLLGLNTKLPVWWALLTTSFPLLTLI